MGVGVDEKCECLSLKCTLCPLLFPELQGGGANGALLVPGLL